jgi:predicted membrane-bound mannosyltransferase
VNTVSTVLVVFVVVIVLALVGYWYVRKNYNTQLSLLEFFANPLKFLGE